MFLLWSETDHTYYTYTIITTAGREERKLGRDGRMERGRDGWRKGGREGQRKGWREGGIDMKPISDSQNMKASPLNESSVVKNISQLISMK